MREWASTTRVATRRSPGSAPIAGSASTPSRPPEERVAHVLGRPRDVTVSRHVTTDELEATHRGMHGSPTILVDGTDPFAGPGQAASVSCRLYRGSDWRPEGAP
jgi:hypothetical protein